MTSALARLDDALPDLDWGDITDTPSGAIRLTPLDAAPEPHFRELSLRTWAVVSWR